MFLQPRSRCAQNPGSQSRTSIRRDERDYCMPQVVHANPISSREVRRIRRYVLTSKLLFENFVERAP